MFFHLLLLYSLIVILQNGVEYGLAESKQERRMALHHSKHGNHADRGRTLNHRIGRKALMRKINSRKAHQLVKTNEGQLASLREKVDEQRLQSRQRLANRIAAQRRSAAQKEKMENSLNQAVEEIGYGLSR